MSYTLLDDDEPTPKRGKFVLLDDEPPQRSTAEELLRQGGRTVRHVAEGAAGLVSPFANALGATWNLTAGIAGAPRMGTDAVGAVAGVLDRLGLPKDEGALEEFTGAINRGVVGAGGGIGAARQVGGQVANALGGGAGAQLTGTALGSGAAEVAHQSGAGPGYELAAGLIAGSAPSIVHGLGAAGVRGLLRGGEQGRQQFNQRATDFANAGITSPSVGQASGARRVQAVESTLSRAPGGAGVMVKAAEEGADEMAARIAKLADDVMPGADATRAGHTIEKGLKNFVERFKAEQNFLYGKLDSMVPKSTRVDIDNTKAVLGELNADIAGAPATSKFFQNARIKGIEGALKSDTETTAGVLSRVPSVQQTLLKMLPENEREAMLRAFVDGKLPWEALTKLRTLVGREISDHSLASDVPRSKWKALYGALSEDMGVVAQSVGPDAERALARANAYTRAGHNRIEGTLDRVSGKSTAEKVFLAAVNPSELKEGASTIGAVRHSMSPEEWKVVTAATLKRMGTATPGNQDNVGDVFSSQTFLTNWNKVSEPARRILFPNSATRDGLNDLALAASRIKEGSKVFANPSGTAQQGVAQGVAGGLAVAVATGNVPIAVGILGGVGTSHASAKLMTNPRFLQWVGKTTRMPPEAFPTQLNFLAQQAKNWPDDDRQAVDEFIQSTGQGR